MPTPNLFWRRDGSDWLLFNNRRRMGRVTAAERELDFEDRRRRANDLQKSQQNEGVFAGTTSPIAQNAAGVQS